jgi:hypothetical protein
MAPIGYSGAKGKLILEKTLSLKISCQTPFKWKCFPCLRDNYKEVKDRYKSIAE